MYTHIDTYNIHDIHVMCIYIYIYILYNYDSVAASASAAAPQTLLLKL